ncbi:MAG: DUF3159 domain-containing protein [Erysipelotrichaceae bacterium]
MRIKLKELWEELRSVVSTRMIDALLPPIVFFIAQQTISLRFALFAALGLGLVFFIFRLYKKQSLWTSSLGLLGVIIAAGLAYVGRDARLYYLPGLLGNGGLVVVTLISLLWKRPLAMLSSQLTRGWPKAWYLHPAIFPSYQKVTWIWLLLFGLRFGAQVYFFLTQGSAVYGVASIILGTPFLLVVLLLSYLLGRYWLQQACGPSVSEFEEQKEPPYQGQKRGF